MNNVALEDKKNYWPKNNYDAIKRYLKGTKSEVGYIDCDARFDYEYWFIVDNLEKIIKVIDYIKNELIPSGEACFWDDPLIKDWVNNVLDILEG